MEPFKGMAPTPDQMNRARQIQKPPETKPKKAKKGESTTRVSLTSGSPPLGLKSEVQQIIYGLHWTYQKRVLDIIKIGVPAEKWDTIRIIVMDIITEQVETTRTLVGRRITDHLVEEQEIKENLNGHAEASIS